MTTYFYHQRIRKAVAMFGAIFNNIYILRRASTGETISQVRVPLSYAPKRDFMERIKQTINGEEAERLIAVKLPRMSFEIVNILYDSTRQLPKMNTSMQYSSEGTPAKMPQGVPYTISMQLNIYAKSQDDALQIVEQIIPYFNPHYTLSIKPFQDYPEVSEDVPLTLTSVDFSDDYENMLEARRSIIWTLNFDMQVNFYGNVGGDGSIIEQANVYLGLLNTSVNDSELFEKLEVTYDQDSDGNFLNFVDTWYDLEEFPDR